MSTPESPVPDANAALSSVPAPSGGTDTPPPAKQKRSPWVWVSAVLAIAAAGLLFWALSTRSDLSAAEQENAAMQTTIEQGSAAVSTAATEASDAYNDLSETLGATTEDLAEAEAGVTSAQKEADQAEKEAKQAKDAAESAQSETEKLEAEAEQAKAEADGVRAKAAVAADCASAYVSAFGSLLQAADPAAQAEQVKQQLAGITEECKAALGGS